MSARSTLLGPVTLLLSGCSLLAQTWDPTYWYEYDASCPSLSYESRRAEVLRIGNALALNFNGKLQGTFDDRENFAVSVILPLVPGAPYYRENSSGAIALSTQSDRLGRSLGIVINKVPKEEDELERNIERQVQAELAVNCPKWKTMTGHTYY